MTRPLKRILRVHRDTWSLLDALGQCEPGPDLDLELNALLQEARHQADLLRHPYLAPEHIRLAVAKLRGDEIAYRRLKVAIPEGLPAVRWRPRGIWSARRRHGVRATERAYRAALLRDERLHDPPGRAPSQ